MEKNTDRKTKICGLVFTALMLALTWYFRESFLADEEHGMTALAMTLSVSACILLLSFFRPKKGKILTPLYHFFAFVAAPVLMVTAIELLNTNLLWEIKVFDNILMNCLICMLLYMLVYAVSGSLRISICTVSPLALVFGIANMYVKKYKGSPLLPWDLGSIKTAANVAGTFSFDISFDIVFGVACLLLVFMLAMHLQKEKRPRIQIALRVICLAVFTGLTGTFYMTDIMARNYGATPDFFNQTRGYESKGALAEFIVNTKYMSLNSPDGYNAADVEELAAENTNPESSMMKYLLGQEAKAPAKQPNVIVIMNESFSDLGVIGDFETNIPVMPFIESMRDMENVIEGNTYVSTIGTGTSNTEYEFLTGNPMAFLPIGSNAYQLYVDHTQPGLVSTLKSQGYGALAFHPYYESSWNRVSVYNNMGFEDFITIEDMKNPPKLRRFVSDFFDFKEIERMYEERDPDQPFFMFNITMQNHSSYEKEYANFRQEVELTGLEGTYPETNQYLSLIKRTDESFEQLIRYFSNTEEPTVILMFGDHQPFIENRFYEEVMGEKLSQMDDATAQLRYITRFILWANYDIPEGWVDRMSVNYLSCLLSEAAGLEKTGYQNYLTTLYEKIPVITTMGCIENDGTFFVQDDSDARYAGDMDIYRNIAYNNLREDEKRADSLFYLNR